MFSFGSYDIVLLIQHNAICSLVTLIFDLDFKSAPSVRGTLYNSNAADAGKQGGLARGMAWFVSEPGFTNDMLSFQLLLYIQGPGSVIH